MSVVDIIERGGDLLVSSETIAEGSGVEHRAVLQLIGNNIADFEEFGQLAFEMRPGYNNAPVRLAMLNEQQATLLMTFQRNTPQVREFKKALVRAFFEMARRITAPVPDITTPEGVLALAQTLTRTAEELVAARNTVAVLEPRAEAWDELASADGDYAVRDAAAILVRAGIKTGPQRLFDTLGEIGWTFRGEGRRWRPYAKTLDAGYMAERAMPPRYDHDGILQPVPPQVRITARGLERLRVRLGVLSPVEVAS